MKVTDKKLTIGINEVEDKEPTHVHDFISYGSGITKDVPNEEYARWILSHYTLSAMCKMAFDQFMKSKLLFGMYEGKKYRISGASRLGDIWLHSELNPAKAKAFYEKRVCVDDISNWSKS